MDMNIITSPIAPTSLRAAAVQPNTNENAPTLPSTVPYAVSSADVTRTTLAICCQKTKKTPDRKAKLDKAIADFRTLLAGKGFSSRSEPRSSSSSCQPGKVHREHATMTSSPLVAILSSYRISHWTTRASLRQKLGAVGAQNTDISG